MQRHALLEYCLTKPDAVEGHTPKGHRLEVTVGGQAFAIFGPEIGAVTLKCGQNSEESAVWRETFLTDVLVAPYIGEFGWNTFSLHGDVDDDSFRRAVDLSYADVVSRIARTPTTPTPTSE